MDYEAAAKCEWQNRFYRDQDIKNKWFLINPEGRHKYSMWYLRHGNILKQLQFWHCLLEECLPILSIIYSSNGYEVIVRTEPDEIPYLENEFTKMGCNFRIPENQCSGLPQSRGWLAPITYLAPAYLDGGIK
jgi:hypothetical protein